MIKQANFSEQQKQLLSSIGLKPFFSSDFSEIAVEQFVDKVSSHLQAHGLGDTGLNHVGQMCEDILNTIADI